MLYKKIRINTGASDFRRRVLRPAQGFVYDLWVLRWVFMINDDQLDEASLNAALSLRNEDQRDDDAVGVSNDDIYTLDQLFFPFTYFHEAPTDVGLLTTGIMESLVFPKAYTVPYMAVVSQENITVVANLIIEVWYERRVPSKEEAAHLVLSAGGRART